MIWHARTLRGARSAACTLAVGVGVFAITSIAAPIASAEEAGWVRAEIRLNLRTGPGRQFRILDGVGTGDEVRILQRGDGWTQVRLMNGKIGWIPGGYLQPEPPPTVRLGQLEQEAVKLRGELEALTAERDHLASTNDALSSNDDTQQSEIDRLSKENIRLRAAQRPTEWITGGAMILVGMLLGALLHRTSSRRSSTQRLRL